MMIGAPPDATIKLPGLDVTRYSMIPVPPSLTGGANQIEADSLPHVAMIFIGTPGTDTGMMLFETLLAGHVPIAFTATTVNVYPVPLVNQVRRIKLPHPVNEIFPGFDVAT